MKRATVLLIIALVASAPFAFVFLLISHPRALDPLPDGLVEFLAQVSGTLAIPAFLILAGLFLYVWGLIAWHSTLKHLVARSKP